jgi:hypothetical protein
VSVAFAWRAGLLDLDGDVTTDQYKAMLAFIGTSLAGTATLVGALVTRSQNLRTVAVQQRENDRLALDTVVKSLELIAIEGTYSPPAKIAGALATMVHLGHPVIAMLTTAAVWDQQKLSPEAGCWLVGQTLERGSDVSKHDAASLLLRHAAELPVGSNPGELHWPEYVSTRWRSELPYQARVTLALTMGCALMSRPSKWWRGEFTGVISLSHSILTTDPSEHLKHVAASMIVELAPDVTTDSVLVETGFVPLPDLVDEAVLARSSVRQVNGRCDAMLAQLHLWRTTDAAPEPV